MFLDSSIGASAHKTKDDCSDVLINQAVACLERPKNPSSLVPAVSNEAWYGSAGLASSGLVGMMAKAGGAEVSIAPTLLKGLLGAAAISGADYSLDRYLSNKDAEQHWYSMPASLGQPRSTIFKPSTFEALATGAALAMPMDIRWKAGLVAGAWLLGRVDNYIGDMKFKS